MSYCHAHPNVGEWHPHFTTRAPVTLPQQVGQTLILFSFILSLQNKPSCMEPLGPLQTTQCLSPCQLPGFTISHVTLSRPHFSMTLLCILLCLHTIHLWTNTPQISDKYPRCHRGKNEMKPEKRLISHFTGLHAGSIRSVIWKL